MAEDDEFGEVKQWSGEAELVRGFMPDHRKAAIYVTCSEL
jgi:hypothetical protein